MPLDKSTMLRHKVGNYSPVYTASYPPKHFIVQLHLSSYVGSYVGKVSSDLLITYSTRSMTTVSTAMNLRVPQRQRITCPVENLTTFEERSSASVTQIWTFSELQTDDSDPTGQHDHHLKNHLFLDHLNTEDGGRKLC
jgi:hypothetical protein